MSTKHVKKETQLEKIRKDFNHVLDHPMVGDYGLAAVLRDQARTIELIQKDLSALSKIIMFDKRDALKEEIETLKTQLSDLKACQRADDNIITKQAQSLQQFRAYVAQEFDETVKITERLEAEIKELRTCITTWPIFKKGGFDYSKGLSHGLEEGKKMGRSEVTNRVMPIDELAEYIKLHYPAPQIRDILRQLI